MKTNITISIDSEVYLELKGKNIVISHTVNNYLRSYLNLKEEPKVKDLEKLKKKALITESKLVKLREKIDKQEKETKEKEKHIRWI